jgi:hypothetical protein
VDYKKHGFGKEKLLFSGLILGYSLAIGILNLPILIGKECLGFWFISWFDWRDGIRVGGS